MKSSKIKKRILVVDNDKTTVETISKQVESGGYLPVKANGADEALDQSSKQKIDLALIDIMMPNVDGIILCKLMNEDEKTSNIPVILFSALDINSPSYKHSDKIKNLSNVKELLGKPFSSSNLLKTITSVMDK